MYSFKLQFYFSSCFRVEVEERKVALWIRVTAGRAVGRRDFMRVIPILVILFPRAWKSTQKTCLFQNSCLPTQNHKSLQHHRRQRRKSKYLKMALNSASRKEPLGSPLAASQTAFKIHERPSRPFSSRRILILVKTWRRSRLCRSSECNWLRNTLVSVGSSKPRPTVAPHVKMSVARYVPHVKQYTN